MPEHCDKCGTELDPGQSRHQRYVFESAADDTETTVGRLCSDCFFDFRDWLDTESVTASE